MRVAHPGSSTNPHPPRYRLGRFALIAVAVALAPLAACDKASHENIDKWLETQKGPGKLADALHDGDLSPDLRGHAAVNLIRLRKGEEVYDSLDKMSDKTRQAVVAKMVPRLWQLARVEGRMTVPSPVQMEAKDGLFYLRKRADEATKLQIDAHLVDWLTGGYYKGRAETGTATGAMIVRAAAADTADLKPADDPVKVADKMIAALNAVVAAPPDKSGQPLVISDEIVYGVALTGRPEAVGKLLELADSKALNEKHPKLERQVMVMLERAYTDTDDVPKADPRGLAAHMDVLGPMASDERRSIEIQSIALNLVKASGMPTCLNPLVGMISAPHSNARFRWAAAQRALDCGQVAAIVPVAEAFPAGGEYSKLDIDDSLISRMKAMTPKADVVAKARTLLGSDKWVPRAVGIELLGALALKSSAAEDAARLRQLAGDKTTLNGWWGDQEDVPKAKRKKDPTLGALAAEVAKGLEELAKGSPK